MLRALDSPTPPTGRRLFASSSSRSRASPSSSSHTNSDGPGMSRSNGTNSKRRRLYPKSSHSLSKASERQHDNTGATLVSLRLRGNPKLAQKILQVVETSTAAYLDELARQLEAYYGPANTTILKPSSYKFQDLTDIRDGSVFLQMIPKLAMAIESNLLGEQNHRIKKRIALAQFYNAYSLAQDNPETFLSWCGGQLPSQMLLPRGGLRSMVQQRFAELMFTDTSMSRNENRIAVNPPSKVGSLQSGVGKIQTWRKNGKHWAQMIMRFGNAILLLVPPSLTDEE